MQSPQARQTMPNSPAGESESLRRLRWQCRRGMLENDLVLTRFLDLHGAELSGDRMQSFRQLLELSDNELWDLISGRIESTEAQRAIVAMLRSI